MLRKQTKEFKVTKAKVKAKVAGRSPPPQHKGGH
jgi:hypothetical protein